VKQVRNPFEINRIIKHFLSIFKYPFERVRSGAIDPNRFTKRATRKTKRKREFFTDAESYTFGDRWDLWGKGRISWKRVFTVAGHALRNSPRVPPAITHAMAPSSSPLKFVQATTLLNSFFSAFST